MTFAQYIVFAEEMYESDVNDNADVFPKDAVDAYPGSYWGQICLHFVDWGDPSSVKEFMYSQLEFVVGIFYHLI